LILPTKRLGERALLSVGADLLGALRSPKTISALWSEISSMGKYRDRSAAMTFDWFVLGLDLLYGLGVIAYEAGEVRRVPR
jgi:hypothetical protein